MKIILGEAAREVAACEMAGRVSRIHECDGWAVNREAAPFAVHHFHEAKGGIASTLEGTAIVDRAFVYDAFETTGSIWLMDAIHRP